MWLLIAIRGNRLLVFTCFYRFLFVNEKIWGIIFHQKTALYLSALKLTFAAYRNKVVIKPQSMWTPLSYYLDKLVCTHVWKFFPVALTLSKNFVDYFHRIKHLLFFYDLLWRMTHFKVSTIKLGYSSSFYSYSIQLHLPAQLARTCQFSNGCWCAVKIQVRRKVWKSGGA